MVEGIHGRRQGGIGLLVLDRPSIDGLFHGHGSVVRWGSRLGQEVAGAARLGAPMRTGRLISSIKSSATPNAIREVIIAVRAEARHSLFVHEGTAGDGAGYIYPTHKKRLVFYDTRGGSRGAKHSLKRVRGQRSNPFLERAMEEVLVFRGIL